MQVACHHLPNPLNLKPFAQTSSGACSILGRFLRCWATPLRCGQQGAPHSLHVEFHLRVRSTAGHLSGESTDLCEVHNPSSISCERRILQLACKKHGIALILQVLCQGIYEVLLNVMSVQLESCIKAKQLAACSCSKRENLFSNPDRFSLFFLLPTNQKLFQTDSFPKPEKCPAWKLGLPSPAVHRGCAA